MFPFVILPLALVDMFLGGFKLMAKPYIQLQSDDVTTNRLLLKSDLYILRGILQREYRSI